MADPDQRSASTIASALRAEGMKVTSAPDAVTLMMVAKRSEPDAIVMRTGLPGGSWRDLIGRLQGNIATALVPLVVLAEDQSQADEVITMGVAGVMPSPHDPADVLTEVKKALGHPVEVPTFAPRERIWDPQRLSAVRSSGLLDREASAALCDRYSRLVAHLLDVPIALVSIVDSDRQVFASQQGLTGWPADQGETPLTHSFCQWVVSADEPLVISDAREHPVLKQNLATTELDVIAYCGVPIRDQQGRPLGSLCAIATEPRDWSAQQLSLLQDLVEGLVAEVELLRRSG